MLKLMLESNASQIEELKDPKVAAETHEVAKRVDKFESEQDKQVMCNTIDFYGLIVSPVT